VIYNDRPVALELVQDIFGEWVDPHERRPPPCISIPITPEMRARDAARQSFTSSDWKIKATLSEANLGIRPMPKPKVVQRRTAPPKPGPRHCPCGRKLAKDNPRGTCYLCRWQYKCRAERRARRKPCDTTGCRRLLRFGREKGLCEKCTMRAHHAEVKRRWRARKRASASRTLRAGNPSGNREATYWQP
jgi:hypothetical protein